MMWTRKATELSLRARSKVRRVSIRTKSHLRHMVCRARGKPIVHFLHIGKCGGTAVREALRNHLDDGKFAIFLRGHTVTLRQVPEGEKVIFLLRDPLTRFVSAFYGRQRQDMPRYHVPWSSHEAIAFSRFQSPNQLAKALSSSDTELRQQALNAVQSIQHVKDSFYRWFEDDAYFLSRIDDILFIGFQEQLDSDFDQLKRALWLSDGIQLPANDTAAHRNPTTVDRSLDDVATANLQAWYGQDLHFYLLCKGLRDRPILHGTSRRVSSASAS